VSSHRVRSLSPEPSRSSRSFGSDSKRTSMRPFLASRMASALKAGSQSRPLRQGCGGRRRVGHWRGNTQHAGRLRSVARLYRERFGRRGTQRDIPANEVHLRIEIALFEHARQRLHQFSPAFASNETSSVSGISSGPCHLHPAGAMDFTICASGSDERPTRTNGRSAIPIKAKRPETEARLAAYPARGWPAPVKPFALFHRAPAATLCSAAHRARHR
jgi:hypothetical protein